VGFVSNSIKGAGVLHVGCGGDPLPAWLSGMKETRLDVNADCKPDIVADMTDLGDIGEFDVVFCQHALEHLHPFDVRVALDEFKRVLTKGGAAIVFVPDVEGVVPDDTELFESPAGPITGLDLFYGFNKVSQDMPYMKHQTAFIKDTLTRAIEGAGFSQDKVDRLMNYNMIGVGIK